MSVDLSLASHGRIKFDDGKEIWCYSVEKESDDCYSVRIEDGWYNTYRRNGESIFSGSIYDKNGNVRHVKGSSIVEFEP